MDIDIFSGEKFQNICDVYISSYDALQYNPNILMQKEKHLLFTDIPEKYNNRNDFIKHAQCPNGPIQYIYVVGEAVAQHQGWAEGALTSVENIIKELTNSS